MTAGVDLLVRPTKGFDRAIRFPLFPVLLLAYPGKTCRNVFEPRLRAILRPRPGVVLAAASDKAISAARKTVGRR
jgi:hypothetical protein